MKKQVRHQEEIIDLEAFDNDISLWQMLPSGRGMGQALLKTHVDAVLNGRATLHSMLITGPEGLRTTAGAFVRSLGIDNFNQTDASLLQTVYDLHIFFCAEQYEAYIITNLEWLDPALRAHLYDIFKKRQLRLYNYGTQNYDIYDIPGVVVMTSKVRAKVAWAILDAIQHTVELEGYTSGQLELIILQRLKYAKIDYENEYILKNIVRYGNNELNKCIRLMTCCVAVMQAGRRQTLLKEDIIKGVRLSRISVDQDNDADIPF